MLVFSIIVLFCLFFNNDLSVLSIESVKFFLLCIESIGVVSDLVRNLVFYFLSLIDDVGLMIGKIFLMMWL